MRGSGEHTGPVRSSDLRADSCPACERYIGPAPTCPYCEQAAVRSPVLKRMRAAALLLAVVGLCLVYVSARCREIPTVDLAHLTPMMNHAAVCISGTVCRKPFQGETDGVIDYVSFRIGANGGELRVCAYDEAARDLVGNGTLPQAGDLIMATGQLRVSAGGEASLRLRRERDVKILQALPGAKPGGTQTTEATG